MAASMIAHVCTAASVLAWVYLAATTFWVPQVKPDRQLTELAELADEETPLSELTKRFEQHRIYQERIFRARHISRVLRQKAGALDTKDLLDLSKMIESELEKKLEMSKAYK